MNLEKIRKIEGLEEYAPVTQGSVFPFIKIVNSNKVQATLKQILGTIYIGKDLADLEILAKPEEDFLFIPLAFYKDWSIWEKDTFKLLKKSFSKTGKWSDGSVIMPNEVNWTNGQPPTAQEALNFIIMPVSELTRKKIDTNDTPRPMVLAFQFTTKSKVANGNALLNLIVESSQTNELTGIRHGVYKLKTTSQSNQDGSLLWYEYTDAEFVKKLAETAKPIVNKEYVAVQQIIAGQQKFELAYSESPQVTVIEGPKQKTQLLSAKADVVEAEINEDTLF